MMVVIRFGGLMRNGVAGFKVDPLDIDFFGKDVFREAGIAENSVL